MPSVIKTPPFIGMILSLQAKANHGRNRIKQHGHRWQVLEMRGERLLLQSMTRTFRNGECWEHDKRWVAINDDRDFDVLIL